MNEPVIHPIPMHPCAQMADAIAWPIATVVIAIILAYVVLHGGR